MATEMKHKTAIQLSDGTLNEMINLLNVHVATAFDLYSQTKQAHWNVKGIHFIALHELFDELAASVLDYVDMLAERATALGGNAMGTVQMAADTSKLPELPMNDLEGANVVSLLIDRYGKYGNLTRSAIDAADDAGDKVTADLFTEIARGMDKHLYFLQAHLNS